MPTIPVEKDRFFRDLGKKFSAKEFDDLLFDYGLELDEDTSVTAPDEQPHMLKIEVPANRYDLLCHQGLILALRTYIGTSSPVRFAVTVPPPTEQWVAHVRKDTARIRPYFAAAILRGIEFDEKRYKDFIDLQDKLHGNLCRKRTLVAIGTHDLAKMDASVKEVSYEARPPADIHFAPLNKTTSMRADDIMTMYEADKHLSRYLHIIRDSPVYPIIYDNARTVLSMPPIINSNHTKITLDTRDVFVDMTAVDQTKLQMVMNILVSMFSQYCTQPFTVEAVKIKYEHSLAADYLSPNLDPMHFVVRQSQINSVCGFSITRQDSCTLLNRMGLEATPASSPAVLKTILSSALNSSSDGIKAAQPDDVISVLVPPTRPDILHECDLIEDVAVAYGFNNIKKTFPSTNTVGKPFAPSKLGDIVRRECALAGWLEVLPLTLCSHDENFAFLNRKDDGTTAVVLSNPATFEYQVVRTSLLPGLLKTIRENRKRPLPMRIFEVSDVVLKDDGEERRARNVRRLGGLFTDKKAGFEVVHGLLDRVMDMLDAEFEVKGGGTSVAAAGKRRAARYKYWLEQSDDPTFLPGRAAQVWLRPVAPPAKSHDAPTVLKPSDATATDGPVDDLPSDGRPAPTKGPLDSLKSALQSALPREKAVAIGTLGIIHPSVLSRFELDYPCSYLEIDLAPFL